jgi:hypothetical protein
MSVLISRCAWHRRYHGYTKLLGISSWQGLHVSFTDGICQKCAARVRADHLRSPYGRGAAADRRETPWLPGLAAVTLSLAVALVLVARPTHELPAPMLAMLPPAPATAPPAPVVALPSAESVTEPPPSAQPSQPRPIVTAHAGPHPVGRVGTTRLSALPRRVLPMVGATFRVPPRESQQSP